MSANQISRLLPQLFQSVQQGQFAVAAQLADALACLSVNDPRFYHAAGVAYLNTGQHPKALIQLEKFVGLVKGQHGSLNVVADLSSKVGDYAAADKYFGQAIAASPNTYQYYFNFALSKIARKDWPAAKELLQKALALAPQFLKARKELVRVFLETAQFDAALALFDAIVQSEFDWSVYYLRAQTFEQGGQLDQAYSDYNQALAFNPKEARIYEALCQLQLTFGNPHRALELAREGVRQLPASSTLNLLLSNLNFELEQPNPLAHYEVALRACPSDNLYADYISQLVLHNESERSQQVLANFEHCAQDQSVFLASFCLVKKSQGDYAAIIDVLAKFANMNVRLMDYQAQAYIATGDLIQAQNIVTELLQQHPENQYYWALQATIYKYTDQAKYNELYDFEQLVHYVPLEVPEGYSDIDDFNAQLTIALQQLHITKVNPLGQTGKGGTQTPGFLFDQKVPVIQDLQKALKQTIENAFARAGTDRNSTHPVKSRNTGKIDIVTAWSMWLKAGGYHVSHVHPKGWYSSAYYVSIPDEVNTDSTQGAIGFGKPGIDLANEGTYDKILTPRPGYIALFPSMMWHGTVPFDSQEPRVVVAFDMLPAR